MTKGVIGALGLVPGCGGDLLAKFFDERMERTCLCGADLLETLLDVSQDFGCIGQRAKAELTLAGEAVGANFIDQSEADVDVGFDQLQAGLLVGAASIRQKSPGGCGKCASRETRTSLDS